LVAGWGMVEGRDFQRIEGGRPDLAALAGGLVHLVDCDLSGADLSRLDMAGWWFQRCQMREAKVMRAVLDGATFEGCRGAFADFRAARMAEAALRSCDFNNANFGEAVLTGARISGCKLTGADLVKAGTIGLVVEESLLVSARMKGVTLRRARLVGVDFSMADLSACDFREAVFEGCSLREAITTGARFEGADLRGADLGGLTLSDAGRFKGATVSRAQAAELLAQLGLQVR
jgi:fluoroquinolone resistance protein